MDRRSNATSTAARTNTRSHAFRSNRAHSPSVLFLRPVSCLGATTWSARTCAASVDHTPCLPFVSGLCYTIFYLSYPRCKVIHSLCLMLEALHAQT